MAPPTQRSMLQFMESQAAYIESRVRMIMKARIQYADLVGISREASPDADVITYYSYDGTGQMTRLANGATNIPRLEVTEAQHNVAIEWDALSYGWTDRDIRRAMYTGKPLSDRLVRQAFRIAEEQKERYFLNGDPNAGWDGILKHADIPRTVSGKTFAASTDRELFEIVNNALGAAWEATNEVRMCDTLLLPVTQYVELQRPMGNDANRSVREYIEANNIYTAMTGRPLMIRTLRQLNDAGRTMADDADADRMLVYPRDMDVIRYHIPQELNFLEPMREGMGWVYYGWMALGGLEIMEPNAMRYVDGI